MDAEPQPIKSATRQPPDIAVVDDVPPQMTCQAYSIPGHQDVEKPRLPSDQQDQDKERHAAVEEGVTMAANTQQPDIQVGEDCAQVARNDGREKNADSLTGIGAAAGPHGYVAHEQQDADRTVFGPVNALLPEEAEDTPIEYECQAEGHGKRDKYGDDLLPSEHLHSVYGVAAQP